VLRHARDVAESQVARRRRLEEVLRHGSGHPPRPRNGRVWANPGTRRSRPSA
jgi:hypothetical protein